MDIKFKGTGTETVKAVFRDVLGNETPYHGELTVASSDESVATGVLQADGVSVVITGTGKVGVATITATDAQDNISDFATVTNTAGEATSIALVEVVAAPAAAPAADAPAAEAAPAAAATDASAVG